MTLPRIWMCLVGCALVFGACGGDDDSASPESDSGGGTAKSTDTTRSEPGGAASGKKDTPTFEAVKKVALREVGRCPGQAVRPQISRTGQKQRGIVEFPVLFCDELPVLVYVRYEDEDARERDAAELVDPKTVEIPYFVNANVLATALLTTDEGPREALPSKIRDACGCGEVREPTGR